jgi:hypothetical protein
VAGLAGRAAISLRAASRAQYRTLASQARQRRDTCVRIHAAKPVRSPGGGMLLVPKLALATSRRGAAATLRATANDGRCSGWRARMEGSPGLSWPRCSEWQAQRAHAAAVAAVAAGEPFRLKHSGEHEQRERGSCGLPQCACLAARGCRWRPSHRGRQRVRARPQWGGSLQSPRHDWRRAVRGH